MKLPSAERSAQAGIVLLFIVVIRSLAEYFRLQRAYGYALPGFILNDYVGGALIAVVAVAMCVLLYFARWYRSVVVLVIISIVGLFVFKIRYIHYS